MIKYGTYKGNQRYWCNECQHKFKGDETPFHGKKPSIFVFQSVADYYNGDGLLKIANRLYRQYGYLPFKRVIWGWIQKYTDLAVKRFDQDKPQVGLVWEITETPLVLDTKEKVWAYHVIDTGTRFLLASYAAEIRSTQNVSIVMLDAQKRAGKSPKKLILDSTNYTADKVNLLNGCRIEFGEARCLADAEKAGSRKLERFHGKIRDKINIVCAFKSLKNLSYFNTGWAIHYNYFKPLPVLNGKTPAEAAGLKYNIKNWSNIVSNGNK